MRRYLLKAALVAATLLCLHFLIVAFMPSPISASYWVREAIIIKRHLAIQLPSPKIIFLGGSATLFGIDARAVNRELGVPAVNYGLHACLHFNVLAGEARLVAKPGDILVMQIEPAYYREQRSVWTDCQLRNAIAWGHHYLDSLTPYDRLRFIFISGKPTLSLEMIGAKIGAFLAPSLYANRLNALASPETVEARYAAGTLRTTDFSLSAYNLSERGDITNAVGNRYAAGGDSVEMPGAIFPETKARLTEFVREMKGRGVRVLIAHGPYLVEGVPPRGWRNAERAFASDVRDIGAELLDNRDELFLPRAAFFNTQMHLNQAGRQVRTERAIADLRRLGIGAPRTAAITSAGGDAR